jgi:hypothetical protein
MNSLFGYDLGKTRSPDDDPMMQRRLREEEHTEDYNEPDEQEEIDIFEQAKIDYAMDLSPAEFLEMQQDWVRLEKEAKADYFNVWKRLEADALRERIKEIITLKMS